MNKAVLYFLIAILMASSALSIELQNFKYERQIKVDCNNFIGYAKIIASDDLLAKSQNLGNLYIDSEYFVQYGLESKTPNWYVQDSNAANIDELKSVFDGSSSTYYSIEKPNDELDIELKNPNSQVIDKIVLSLKDSELAKAEFYVNDIKLNPSLVKDNFAYSYYFYPRLSTSSITIRLYFENILKVAEMELYARDRPNIFFFVNNECSRTYNMYYGEYGGSEKSYAKYDMTATTSAVLLDEKSNPAYNDDFDNDTIANENDNCPLLANKDQQDFNYNGKGDACEDFDYDSIINSKDNCIYKYNYDQSDVDKDGIGDVCDPVDNRFSERNKWIFYIGAGLAVLTFLFIAYSLLKPSSKK